MARKPGNEHECNDVSLHAVILFTLLSSIYIFGFVSPLFNSKDDHWVTSYPSGAFQILRLMIPTTVKSFWGSVEVNQNKLQGSESDGDAETKWKTNMAFLPTLSSQVMEEKL